MEKYVQRALQQRYVVLSTSPASACFSFVKKKAPLVLDTTITKLYHMSSLQPCGSFSVLLTIQPVPSVLPINETALALSHEWNMCKTPLDTLQPNSCCFNAYWGTNHQCSCGTLSPQTHSGRTEVNKCGKDHRQLKHVATTNKKYVDQQWNKAPTFQPGVKVWLPTQNPRSFPGCPKLSAHYTGPFKIVCHINLVTYKLDILCLRKMA